MTLDPDVERLAHTSVLCWLATSSESGQPSVSPKQIFAIHEHNAVVIANIASPGSARNIRANPRACVSFIDIFTQRGYQIKGRADVLTDNDPEYGPIREILVEMTKGVFPFRSVFRVHAQEVSEILAPRYRLFPETTERDQIEDALETYNVRARE